MRILIVSEVFRPAVSGVTVAAERLASGLAARGHTVLVLTARLTPDALAMEKVGGYAVCRLASVPNPFRPGLRLTALNRAGVRRIFREFAPEVVHIQDVISLSLQAVRLARRQNVPVLATHHFLPEYVLAYLPNVFGLHAMTRGWLLRRLGTVYAGCSAIIVPTESVRQALLSSKLPAPLVVVSNGVDSGRFKPGSTGLRFRREHGLAQSEPLALCVGRLDPEKRVHILLRAVAQLPPTVRLAVVGTGARASELQEEAARLGCGDRVVWISHLEGPELVAAYQAADLFCIASPIETESIVTLEAMASGLPVVAADSGALPELVQSGRTGYLVDTEDPSAWAVAMGRLLDDEELRRRLGREARRVAKERDLGQSIERIEALYRKALVGRGV